MVLLANDHLLKGAGVLPGWVTGKLSDLAGYFLFPSLLAVILRVRTRRGLLFCHLAATALLFLTELSPAFCRLIRAVSGHRLWPDPTDLVALVSIGLSWRVLARLALQPEPPRVVRDRRSKALVFIGAVASVATSPRRPPTEPVSWASPTEVFIQNSRSQLLQVRVSAPRTGVVFHCDSVLQSPHTLFSESQFQVINHVTLGPGDALPLNDATSGPEPDCHVFLLAVEGTPQRLVAWRSGSYSRGDSVELAGGRISIGESGLDAPAGLLWPAPSEPATPPPVACLPSDPSSEPTWSLSIPGPGTYTLRRTSLGGDGCTVLTLNKDSRDSSFTVCSDPVSVPFVVGDTMSFRTTADGSDGLVIDGLSAGKAVTLTLVRRAYELAATPFATPCSPVRRTCGAAEAVAMTVPTLLGPTRPLARGEQEILTNGASETRVTLLRAETVRLADHSCDAQEALGAIGSYITLSTR